MLPIITSQSMEHDISEGRLIPQHFQFHALLNQVCANTSQHRDTLRIKWVQLRDLRGQRGTLNGTHSFVHQAQLTSRVGNECPPYNEGQYEGKVAMLEIEKKDLLKEIEGLSVNLTRFKQLNQQLAAEVAILEESEKRTILISTQSKFLLLQSQQKLAIFQQQMHKQAEQDKLALKILKRKAQQLSHQVQPTLCQHLSQKEEGSSSTNSIFITGAASSLPKGERKAHAPSVAKPQTTPYVYEYSKLALEDIFRTFYLLSVMRQCWEANRQFCLSREVAQLPTKAQIRLLSRTQILTDYESRGLLIGDALIDSMIEFHQRLSDSFLNEERNNLQIQGSRDMLTRANEQQEQDWARLRRSKESDTIKSLEEEEKAMHLRSKKLNRLCQVIFQFNIRFFELLKKFTKFNITLQKLLHNTHRHLPIVIQESNFLFMRDYEILLQKNPEDSFLLWGKIINSGPEGKAYVNYLMANDLLRLHASPSMHSLELDDLDNLNETYSKVFRFEETIIKQLTEKLTRLLKVSLEGIEQLLVFADRAVQPGQMYCVESNDYFRRDNFKLLEKLQRQSLKKRGLLEQIPFNVNPTNELTRDNKPRIQKNSIQLERSQAPSRVMYNALTTRREENSHRKRSIQKLLGNLQAMGSRSKQDKYRIHRKNRWTVKTNTQNNSFNNSFLLGRNPN